MQRDTYAPDPCVQEHIKEKPDIRVVREGIRMNSFQDDHCYLKRLDLHVFTIYGYPSKTWG